MTAMYAHHQRAIERLIAELRDDPRYLALRVGGSVAKGRARPDSDVDIVLVATDAEFTARLAAGEIQYLNREWADWPGGYIEGKILDRRFLRDVADHGSEPARAAFAHITVGFSHLTDLEALLARIPVYLEQERAEKLTAFFSQVELLSWFVPEAVKRNDPYLLTWAASNLVLFGGRLILAYNRILFPYHKWFMYEVRRAPEQPADFLARADKLLAQPSPETARALRDCLAEWQDWGVSRQAAVQRFLLDSEWNWRSGRPPLADW